MTAGDDADRRTIIGPYHVTLHRGPCRSRVSVFDSRLALGQLATGKYRHDEADEKFDEVVRTIEVARPDLAR